MHAITKYQAEDGAEFDSKESCADYECLCADVQEVMSRLPKVPELPACGFANGAGYIQHADAVVKAARDDILRLALKSGVGGSSLEKWITSMLSGEDVHSSWPSRAIDECCPRPLRKAWYRFACMDKLWREWGQPDFATNPDKATQQRLN